MFLLKKLKKSSLKVLRDSYAVCDCKNITFI